jgi:hypothetical protein
MHSLRGTLQNNLIAVSFALMLVVLWMLMQGYQGFAGDAQIYAFQALARIHPALSTDLYLQNTSQDQYTVFSPVYAWFIGWLGLENAARVLTLFFTAWLFAAAWKLAAGIVAGGAANGATGAAWLGAGFLMIAAGDYGAAGVFRISDSFLTARLPAEALVITALACYCYGMTRLAAVTSAAALFVHPLMAFPGILVLICLWLPIRLSLIGAIAGIFATLGVALAATTLPSAGHVFTVMDVDWLEVVRERSQFLFLQLWSTHDWDINLRPLLYLIFIATAMDEERIRRICVAGLIIGSCGLAVALIGCLIGPIAVVVQGQAWRWEWIACLLSILLLPATLLRISRDKTCGPLCSALLIGGWVVSNLGGTACVLLALLVWSQRMQPSRRAVRYLQWMALLSAVLLAAWIICESLGRGSIALDKIRNILGVRVAAVALFGLLWWWLRGTRSQWPPLIVSAGLLIASISILPASFKQARAPGSDIDASEFSEWSSAMPLDSTVFVAPARDVGSFVWFTLRRPNYLALDQSAGVVFSRATALEVRRRSLVLLPLTDPTWKILSGIRRHAAKLKDTAPTRPLTADSLVQVCSDPRLGFVISPENVGFDALRHTGEGAWKDWNLYDCRRARK